MKNSLKKPTQFNLNIATFIALGAFSATNAQAGFELITEQSQEAHNFVSTGDTRNINQKSVDVTSVNEQYAQLAMNARDAERAMGEKPNLKTRGTNKKTNVGQSEPSQPINAPVIEHTDDPKSTPSTLKVGSAEDYKIYNGNLFEIAHALRARAQLNSPPVQKEVLQPTTETIKEPLVGLSGGEEHFQANNQSGESKSLLDIMRENRRTPKTKEEFSSNLLLIEKTKENLALQAENEELRQKLAQYENAGTITVVYPKGQSKSKFVAKKGSRKSLTAKNQKQPSNERIALK